MVESIQTLEQFKQIVSEHKLVVLDFWAEWCGPCKQMLPIFETVSQKLTDRAFFCKVNIGEFDEAAQIHPVRSIPTLVIFKDSQAVSQKVGKISESELEQWVESFI